MGRGANIDSRHQPFNLIAANQTAIDSQQHIGLRPHTQTIHSRVRMRKGQMSLLGEQHIIVQLLREGFVEPDTLVDRTECLQGCDSLPE